MLRMLKILNLKKKQIILKMKSYKNLFTLNYFNEIIVTICRCLKNILNKSNKIKYDNFYFIKIKESNQNKHKKIKCS